MFHSRKFTFPLRKLKLKENIYPLYGQLRQRARHHFSQNSALYTLQTSKRAQERKNDENCAAEKISGAAPPTITTTDSFYKAPTLKKKRKKTNSKKVPHSLPKNDPFRPKLAQLGQFVELLSGKFPKKYSEPFLPSYDHTTFQWFFLMKKWPKISEFSKGRFLPRSMNFCILSSVSVTPPRDLGTITEKMQKISPERRQKYAQSHKFSQIFATRQKVLNSFSLE